MTDGKLYRILSLDGGGTWALVQARALMKVFPDAGGHDVLRPFDLVVSNSGGSTVAASLAVGQSPADIADFILDPDRRRLGFEPTWAERLRLARILPLPRFRTKAKRSSLRRELGKDSETKLTEWQQRFGARPDLVIPAFDCDTERATFFRTNASSLAASRTASGPPNATLLDAVHASTTAPIVFFDEPAAIEGRKFWDGAVAGYNNPVLAGVVEAHANEVPLESIRVLSLGSGSVRRPLGGPLADPRFSRPFTPGLVSGWREFGTAILDDPPDAATFIAHVTLGGRLPKDGEAIVSGPVVRMAPVVRPVWNEQRRDWAWPSALADSDWARLTRLALATIEQRDIELVDSLAAAWINDLVPNQPIRSTKYMTAEIGHDTFTASLAAANEWLRL